MKTSCNVIIATRTLLLRTGLGYILIHSLGWEYTELIVCVCSKVYSQLWTITADGLPRSIVRTSQVRRDPKPSRVIALLIDHSAAAPFVCPRHRYRRQREPTWCIHALLLESIRSKWSYSELVYSTVGELPSKCIASHYMLCMILLLGGNGG